ncbi:DEAD/DEAH box helicase [Vagococcus carniphilus]|uniref:DEAD/DEAH box helicase n=1 Tax=Vagococcus carniphilus TaxID=218144 RepID=UPI003B5BA02B
MTMIENLPKEWQEKWVEKKFKDPSLIQEKMYEPLSSGKSVLGISPTGSGKTLAYLLPLMQQIKKGEGNQLLILLPSQELASQVAEVTREWIKPLELNIQTIIGGANISRQIERLKKRPEVLVGTPGRVLELIKAKKIKAHLINCLVLDEVDDLVSQEDYNAAKSVMKTVLADTQVVAVSATGQVILPEIDQLFRTAPEVIDVTETDDTKGTIKHSYIITPTRKRSDTLRRLAHVEGFKGLVFFNQLSELGVASERLDYLGIEHRTLASDQHQTERKRAIEDFENNKVALLLTTDIGARGLDFSDLHYVVQYDLALHAENYIHRSGRVGRMGKPGEVISLINERDVRILRKITNSLNRDLTETFVSHGQLVDEKIESSQVEEEPKKESKKETKKVELPVSKSGELKMKPKEPKKEQPKKKKKKNRTNRNKNKGASWK